MKHLKMLYLDKVCKETIQTIEFAVYNYLKQAKEILSEEAVSELEEKTKLESKKTALQQALKDMCEESTPLETFPPESRFMFQETTGY